MVINFYKKVNIIYYKYVLYSDWFCFIVLKDTLCVQIVHKDNGVLVTFNDNEHVAVIGDNGCGKTTLLKMLSGQPVLLLLNS